MAEETSGELVASSHPIPKDSSQNSKVSNNNDEYNNNLNKKENHATCTENNQNRQNKLNCEKETQTKNASNDTVSKKTHNQGKYDDNNKNFNNNSNTQNLNKNTNSNNNTNSNTKNLKKNMNSNNNTNNNTKNLNKNTNSNNNKEKVKMVLQQVSSASLLIDNEDSWVHIKHGIVVYIALMKDCEPQDLEKAIENILSASICWHEDWKKNSTVVETKGEVLLIPQASLGGRRKGKMFQYHELAEKEKGQQLYENLVKMFHERFPNVKNGTYGNRQSLKMETNGPFSHLITF